MTDESIGYGKQLKIERIINQSVSSFQRKFNKLGRISQVIITVFTGLLTICLNIMYWILIYYLIFNLVLFILPHADDGGMQSKPSPFIKSTSPILNQSIDILNQNSNYYTLNGTGFKFTQPSLYKYGKFQWLWDSSAAIITQINFNQSDAILEFQTLLKSQLPDGRIPQTNDKLNSIAMDRTQIPAIVYALQSIYQKTGDRKFLNESVYKVANYLDWFRLNRDFEKNGLVSILHPWESGLDASPAYDAVWNFKPFNDVLDFVPYYVNFYLLNWSYSKYDNFTQLFSRKKAEFSLIPNWFVVQDIAVNSVYSAGWEIVSKLVLELNDTAKSAEYLKYYQDSSNAIQTLLWDKDLKRFVTRYIDPNGIPQYSNVQTIQSLFPLLLSNLTDIQKTSLIDDTKNPDKFWTNYPFPSVSKLEPTFTPKYYVNLMWRGPSWGFTNWFVLTGLQKHGRMDLVKEAVERWNKALDGYGIWEMWNPETGVGYGTYGLGMSTVIADWILKIR